MTYKKVFNRITDQSIVVDMLSKSWFFSPRYDGRGIPDEVSLPELLDIVL
jgi:hypothetical protein